MEPFFLGKQVMLPRAHSTMGDEGRKYSLPPPPDGGLFRATDICQDREVDDSDDLSGRKATLTKYCHVIICGFNAALERDQRRAAVDRKRTSEPVKARF